jgi:mRNA interferase MazF
MRGQVVVVPFPFSDLSSSKNRPAVILIDLPGDDAVLAAITSTGSGSNTISLNSGDFQNGKLEHPSFIHPAKLFTFKKNLIARSVGTISERKRREIVTMLVSLLG